MRTAFKLIAFLIFALTGLCVGLILEQRSPAGEAIQGVVQSYQPPAPRNVGSVIIDVTAPSYTRDLVRVIDSAQESIKVYTDVLLLRPVLNALQSATQRGVVVEIVLERTKENEKLVERWIPHNLPNAKLWLVQYSSEPTFMVVDDRTAVVTSLSLSQTDQIARKVIAVVTTEMVTIEDLINKFVKLKEIG